MEPQTYGLFDPTKSEEQIQKERDEFIQGLEYISHGIWLAIRWPFRPLYLKLTGTQGEPEEQHSYQAPLFYSMLCFLGALAQIFIVYFVAQTFAHTGFAPTASVWMWIAIACYGFFTFVRAIFWTLLLLTNDW